MSAEATDYLIEQGIKVMGIDCYGFDRPFMAMVNDFFRTKDNNYLWPAHFLGRKKKYVHMERLCNLDKIPKPYGFKVSCFPIKLGGIGASWIRAVAIIEE
jgi:kynurenine formamidase